MAYRDRDLATQPASIYGMFEFNQSDGRNTTGTLSDMNPPGSRLTFPTDGIDSSIYVDGPDASTGNYAFFHADPNEFFTQNAHLIGSITGWFKRPAFDVFAAGFVFIGNAGGDGIRLAFNPSQNQLRADWAGTGSAVIDSVDLSSRINQWIHFAITWSSASGHKLYIDGVQVGTTQPWFGGFSTLSIDTAYLVSGTGFGTTPKIGLDQITYRNVVLTDQEILDLVGSQPLPVPPPVLIDAEEQPPANVVIWDRNGRRLGFIRPEIESVTYLRNNISKASIRLPKSDYDPDLIKIRNRISILFDNGLEFWAGVIVPNLKFKPDTVEFTPYSAEYLISGRLTDRGRYFDNRTIGNIAIDLLNEANAILPTGIELGEVWTGGNTHSPSYHFKSLFDIYTESLFKRLSLADFYVEPYIDDLGLLKFRLNILQQRGTFKPQLHFYESFNVSDPISYEFLPTLVNEWVIIGQGNEWSIDRPVVVRRDQDSVDRYELFQSSEIHQNVVSTDTLQQIADNLLARTKEPYRVIGFNQLNKPPAQMSQVRLGDTIYATLPSYNVERELIEIMAKAYYPKTGKQDLVLRIAT